MSNKIKPRCPGCDRRRPTFVVQSVAFSPDFSRAATVYFCRRCASIGRTAKGAKIEQFEAAIAGRIWNQYSKVRYGVEELLCKERDTIMELKNFTDLLDKPGQKYDVCFEDAPWSNDDRSWFDSHPERQHRLRKAYPGEWGNFVEDSGRRPDLTMLRNCSWGRSRMPLFLDDDGSDPMDDELTLHAFYDLITQNREFSHLDLFRYRSELAKMAAAPQ